MSEKNWWESLNSMIDSTYMPFEPEELYGHFLVDAEKQIEYFSKSADRYHEFLSMNPDLRGISVSKSRIQRQIEKDERFWTAAALKTINDQPDSNNIWINLLSAIFGGKPPIAGMNTWLDCLVGELHLYFEAQIPSPKKYTEWLRNNISNSHFIPYVLDAASRESQRPLEGPTHLDAILVNKINGFSILFESKVLSDISKQVTFDITRNQLARCIDILLEESDGLNNALGSRDPEKSLFVLLTPEVFRQKPWTRLYGWLLNQYRSDVSALSRDLFHRDKEECINVVSRIGWLTFEDIRSACPKSCRWLN